MSSLFNIDAEIVTEVGEMIETKIERIMTQNEPIEDSAPIIYTERKDGVIPDYDCRTDRFEAAIDAMNVVSKTQLAKRAQRIKEREEKENGKPEPTDPTNK